MKSYELEFDVDALREWRKLDGSVKVQFKKQLAKRLLESHVPSARLHGDLQNTYKIKLRDVGYRLVYEVIEQRLVVKVIAVGRRDHDEVYLPASKRRDAEVVDEAFFRKYKAMPDSTKRQIRKILDAWDDDE